MTKTTLEQWTVLAAVVDHHGFAQAAAILNRSQSAISYAVARLQESLGIALLVTEGRRSVLTPHGRTLLTRARAVIHDLETLELIAQSLRSGWEAELNLVVDAAFPRTRLLEIVAELQRTCPNTQIQLSDAVLSGAEDAITEGHADVVVTTRVPPGHLGDELLNVRFLAVARPDHPLFALDRDLTSEDLMRYVQAVVRDSGGAHRRDDGWLGAERRFTVSSLEASLSTLLAGLAFAWLPEHLVSESLEAGTLKRLPLASGGARTVPLYIVSVRPDLIGPAARATVDAFKRHVLAR